MRRRLLPSGSVTSFDAFALPQGHFHLPNELRSIPIASKIR
jgi:hypothetical protein